MGTLWNMVVLTVMGANGSGGLTWYAGLGSGLLLGGVMTVFGETILRSADISIRRDNGLLAYLSPSWWFRVMFSLVPGLIARAAGSGSSPGEDPDRDEDRYLDASQGNRVILTRVQHATHEVGDEVSLRGATYTIEAVDAGSEGGLDYTVEPA